MTQQDRPLLTDSAPALMSQVREGHPDMPPLKSGADCPWLRDWVHFCDRGWRHKGAHHCPCGLEVDRA